MLETVRAKYDVHGTVFAGFSFLSAMDVDSLQAVTGKQTDVETRGTKPASARPASEHLHHQAQQQPSYQQRPDKADQLHGVTSKQQYTTSQASQPSERELSS